MAFDDTRLCSDPCKHCGRDADGNYVGDAVCDTCGDPSKTSPCNDCVANAEDDLYECPVCERKVTINPDVICGDCFEKGSRATVKW